MKKLLFMVFTVFCFWITGNSFADVAVPHSFQAGQKAVAAEVNANFAALAAAVNGNSSSIASLAVGHDDQMVDLSIYGTGSATGTKTYTGVIYYGKNQSTGEFPEEDITITVTWSPAPSGSDYDTDFMEVARASDGSFLWQNGWTTRTTSTGDLQSLGWSDVNESGITTAEYVFDPPRRTRPGGMYNRAHAWGGELIETGYDTSDDSIIARSLQVYVYHILDVETVTVAAGTFENCLKYVRMRPGAPSDRVYWSAPGVGLIKEFVRYDSGNGHIYELTDIQIP